MSDSNRGKRDADIGTGFAVLTAILLSCLIVGFFSFKLGRDTERDSKRAAEHQEITERRKNLVCEGLAGPLLAKCIVEEERAGRQAYQAERDLNAQRDMALWALVMAVIGGITAGVTVWALVYVRGTLIATKDALKGTNDATAAMIVANDIANQAMSDSKKNAQAQIRAYVYASTVEICVLEICETEFDHIYICLKNGGQSPALLKSLETKAYWIDRKSINIFDGEIFLSTVLPPGEKPLRIPIGVLSEDIIALNNGFNRGKIVVQCEIVYDDIFGFTRKTDITFGTNVDIWDIYPDQKYVCQQASDGNQFS